MIAQATGGTAPTGVPFASLSGIVKRFGGVVALRDANIELFSGEVHALLGENGAGKSTLVNILSGVFPPDAGTISVKGTPVTITSPQVARELGVATVHQHPVVFPELTVAENIMFASSAKRRKSGLLDWSGIRADAREALERLDAHLDPNARVGALSAADQQSLEIVKALTFEPGLLILDEPTAALSLREVDRLMGIIARLKADGVAILFVGHRLNEVFSLADRVTVSRDGATVVTGPASEFTPESAVTHMVGRTVNNLFPKEQIDLGVELLSVSGLTRHGVFADVNFSVREGEILGFAGLVGAGRTEIARAIFGLDPLDAGQVILDGHPVEIRSPQDAMARNIAYVPEDRQAEGVILDHAVGPNLSLTILSGLARLGLLSRTREEANSQRYIDELRIRTSGPGQLVSALSGGNQQKVVLGKWLATNPRILILDDPTKGVDVGAKAEVHHIVSSMARRGLGIILISNELEELLSVADRIITFYRGQQVCTFDTRPFEAKSVMASMTGQG